MITYKGISVALRVNGSDLEHLFEDVDETTDLVTCWVASQPGQEFSIWIKDTTDHKQLHKKSCKSGCKWSKDKDSPVAVRAIMVFDELPNRLRPVRAPMRPLLDQNADGGDERERAGESDESGDEDESGEDKAAWLAFKTAVLLKSGNRECDFEAVEACTDGCSQPHGYRLQFSVLPTTGQWPCGDPPPTCSVRLNTSLR